MIGCSESKIARFGVANLDHSWAMAGPVFINMGRLESSNFDSQTRSPRISQGFLGESL